MRRLCKRRLFDLVTDNIKNDIAQSNIAGASVLVAQGNEILLRECLGYADAKERIPLNGESLFRLASMTKPVTAVAALIGVERGWFSLNDPISVHIPEFESVMVGREENGAVVPDHKPACRPRLYQFLSNTTGFMGSGPLYELEEKKIPASAYASIGSMVDYCVRNTSYTFETGRHVAYCAYQAYDVVATLIERYSDMPYKDFIEKSIFTPLGIKNLTYTPSEEQWSRLVKMSNKDDGRLVSVEMGRYTFEKHPLSYTSGGAGLVGGVDDYYTFARMLLGEGECDGVRIVSPEIFRLMPRSYVPKELMPEDAGAAWGLGVMVRNEKATLPAGSYGWSGAYGTHFWVDPANEIIAIYMKNSRWYDSHGCGKTGREFEKAVVAALED